jgi:hypothetical protein
MAAVTADKPELRALHRELGGLQTYMFQRRASDPEWWQLSRWQQRRYMAAFLIGAKSVDITKVLTEK